MIISISLRALTGAFITDVDRANRAAKKLEKDLKNVGKIIGGAFAAGAAGAALLLKQAIDAADQVGQLAMKIGVTTEALSELQYVAGLADVEDLGESLKKLNKSLAEAAQGTGDQAKAFKAMGIAVLDAKGNIRATDEVLEDIADKFAGYEDGAEKAALAVAVLGKSGADMIPFLNEGAKAIREARLEAIQFGLTVGDNFAKDANAFNDNIDKLQSAVKGLAKEIAEGLIKTLLEASNEAVEFSKQDDLRKWAQDGAIAFVQIGEKARDLVQVLLAVGSSFRAVFADVELLGKFVSRGGPAGLAFESNRKFLAEALEERNKVVEAASERWAKLVETYGNTDLSEKFKENLAVINAFREADLLLARGELGDGPTGPKIKPPKFGAKEDSDAKKAKEELDFATQAMKDWGEAILEASADYRDLAEINDDTARAIAAANDDFADAEREKTRIAQDEALARQQIMQATLDVGTSIFNDLATVAEAAGKKGFKAFKAFSIAQATIDAIAGAIAAFKSAATIPIVGWILAPVAAAAALAAGFAQVARIRSTEPPGYASGGRVTGGRQTITVNEQGTETVMNAQATRRYGGLLDAMNDGAAMAPRGGLQVIQAGPGVVVEQIGDVLTASMLPQIAQFVDTNNAVRISTGKSATGAAIGRRYSLQGTQNR